MPMNQRNQFGRFPSSICRRGTTLPFIRKTAFCNNVTGKELAAKVNYGWEHSLSRNVVIDVSIAERIVSIVASWRVAF